jgi:hypothetical protein
MTVPAGAVTVTEVRSPGTSILPSAGQTPASDGPAGVALAATEAVA